MKMAKPSAKDIAAAEELQQVLIALDENQRWGCAALEDTPDFFQLIDDDEFDPEQGQHAQALYNKLVMLMRENPSFHNRVISGMCHVIMYEKNEIIDPDSDCIDLHPRFAEMWNDLKRETQAARYWNKRYHQVVAELDGAQAKLAAMESQSPVGVALEEVADYGSHSVDFTARVELGQPLYAKPVPSDKPAVPDGALAMLNQIIADLEGGFVSCERCGDQEETANLDCMYDLKKLRNLLASAPSHSQQSAECGYLISDGFTEQFVKTLSDEDRKAAKRFNWDVIAVCRCPSHERAQSAHPLTGDVKPIDGQI